MFSSAVRLYDIHRNFMSAYFILCYFMLFYFILHSKHKVKYPAGMRMRMQAGI